MKVYKQIALFITGVALGAVFFALNAEAATTAKEDQVMLAQAISTNADGSLASITIVQRGQFNCPQNSHRAVLINAANTIWVGCAIIDQARKEVTIVYEDGDVVTFPIGERGIEAEPDEDKKPDNKRV